MVSPFLLENCKEDGRLSQKTGAQLPEVQDKEVGKVENEVDQDVTFGKLYSSPGNHYPGIGVGEDLGVSKV